MARAVYKDAAIYLFDGVLEALGPELAPGVFRDCMMQQLCVKTVVLAESLAMTNEGSVLEMCNMVYLTGARRSDFGLVAGLVGHGELANVQQQSDRWHQRHVLDTSVCAVLAPQARPVSWVMSRLSEEESSLSNAEGQSARWACWWFCAKSRESCVLVGIISISLFGHMLRVLQDWWLQTVSSSTPSEALTMLDTDRETACLILIGSVLCAFLLFSSANALWLAVVAVSTTKTLHVELMSSLCKTSPHIPEDKQLAFVDVMSRSMRESISNFPLHVQTTVHCGAAALGCLVLLTVEIVNIKEGDTPPIVRAFVALPALLLGVGFLRWWTVDSALRRVSYWMAAARGPVRALCATTACSMQQFRIYPHEGAALITMQRLLDRYTSAQLGVCAVQARSIIGVGMLWSFGAMLMAGMLIVLREIELLKGHEGLSVAGLVMALLLQMVYTSQWAIVSASEGAISFHAYVGRIKSMGLSLATPEESHPKSGMVKLGDAGDGWSIENASVLPSPAVPAALVCCPPQSSLSRCGSCCAPCGCASTIALLIIMAPRANQHRRAARGSSLSISISDLVGVCAAPGEPARARQAACFSTRETRVGRGDAAAAVAARRQAAPRARCHQRYRHLQRVAADAARLRQIHPTPARHVRGLGARQPLAAHRRRS